MKILFKATFIFGVCVTGESVATSTDILSASSIVDKTYSLDVVVRGIRNDLGSIVVSLCHEGEKFPSGCSISLKGKAALGGTELTFDDLSEGVYAAALYHDENDDGKLTFIQEGIAFSNDSNLAFGPPQFAPASFNLDRERKIKINMRYFN
jgi:uncharacterized protein (DUF2141 family)